jgi:hypothetical protein
MNAKVTFFNISSASLLTLGLATAYALTPTQEQQVQINTPSFIVEDLDLGPYNDCTSDCSATLVTADYKYQIEVKFDYKGFKDGNGFQTWYDAEIDCLDIIKVESYEDEKEVNAYIDRHEIGLINEALVAEILETRA